MPHQRPRLFSDHVYQSLKTAMRQNVRAVGGQEVAATLSRIGHFASFGRYCRRQDVEHAPVDVALDLDHEAGEPHVLRAMAQALGYVVIPLPSATASPEWFAHAGRMATEAGQMLSGISDALADDGKVDAAEIRRLALLDHCEQAIEAFVSVKETLTRIVTEGRP